MSTLKMQEHTVEMLSLPLDGKVAIVTGGAKGIGAAISEQLVKSGARVMINYNSSNKEARELVSRMNSKGGDVCCMYGDVSRGAEMQEVVEYTYQKFDKIDILINNAGIVSDKLFLDMEAIDWHRVIEINLNGVYYSTRAVLPYMKEQNSGCIVNMSSIVGQMGNKGQANYSAAKAGVIGFTKALAREMAEYNIRVNAICPGFIESPMTDKISPKIKERLIENIPMKRFGNSVEIANTVLFLIIYGTYITGQTINVNGGMYM